MQRPPMFFRLLSIAAACAAGPALATNGYFPHGYGMKAKGMGGASIARAQDTSSKPRIQLNSMIFSARLPRKWVI